MARGIILTPEQEELLLKLVNKDRELRSAGQDRRIDALGEIFDGPAELRMGDARMEVDYNDWVELCSKGLITLRAQGIGAVSPEGIAYAQAVKEKGEEQKSGSKEAYIEPNRPHEAYKKIREIIEATDHELIIEDNYIDRTIFDLLSNVKLGAKIRLLTRTPPKDFALEASKFRQQRGNLEVRVGIADFHDRFIVADDKCWQLGASIKHAGDKAFALNLLEDQVNVERVRKNIEDAWQKGTPLT